MKFLRNKNAPPLAGLVQEFIDTAYDTVKLVADNLPAILEVATAIENGTLDDFLSANDIDSLAKLDAYVLDATLLSTAQIDSLSKLNALVLDEEIASEAYVNAAVAGLYEFMGGYDASTNTPDLTTSPNAFTVAQSWQVTGAGVFFTANVEPGDQLTAIVDNPSIEADWSIVNRNIDSAAFATAAQGAKADTALQPGEAATPAQGALADSATQPGDAVSSLLNDAGYTDDQTDAEIATAYNTVTPIVSQVDAEAAVSTTAERWTPERVGQAIAANAAPGGGGGMTFTHVTINTLLTADNGLYSEAGLTHTLPVTPITGAKCSVWDVSDLAGSNAITILRNGETIKDVADDFSLNMNGGRVDFLYTGTTWEYSYVVQTIQPSTTVTRTVKVVVNPAILAPYNGASISTSGGPGGEIVPALLAPNSSYPQGQGVITHPEGWTGRVRGRVIWSPSNTDVGLCDLRVALELVADGGFNTTAIDYMTCSEPGGGVLEATQISPWSPWEIHSSTGAIGDALYVRFLRAAVTDAFTGTAEIRAMEIEFETEETLTAAVSNNPNRVSRDLTGTVEPLLASDAGLVLYCSNALAQDIQIPDGLPEGFQCIIAWEGVGQPSFSMAGVETAVGDLTPAAQYGRLHVEKRNASVWWGTG